MSLRRAFGVLVVAVSAMSVVAKTHVVGVGRVNGHGFDVDQVNATVGDTIRFKFWPANHSIARAEYMFPCQPIDVTSPEKDPSFWDGFHPTKDGEDGPSYDVKVNDTEPIFYYCAQEGSCTGYGMIGVVWVNNNTVDSKGVPYDFAAHMNAKEKFTTELHPGEKFLSEGGTSAGVGAAANNTESSGSGGKKGLGAGPIAGIAVGAVAAVVIVGLVIWLMKRNKSLSETLRYSRPPPGKVAPLPAMSEGPSSPYPPSSTFPASPAFPGENKMAAAMVAPAPGYNQQDNNHNAHQSWMSQSPTMRAQSPDSVAEHGYNNGGMMSPNAFSPRNSYMQQQQHPVPHQSTGSYHMQSSPSETPWSPGGYNWQNVQPQHEMGAGQEGVAMERQSQMPQGNNGYPTPSHVAAPVELAGDTSDNVVFAAPPVYRPSADGEAVQKPEEKTPAATTRDA